MILCAIDLGLLTRGGSCFTPAACQRSSEADLRILHVSADDSADLRERVVAECERATRYEVNFDGESVIIATGRVSEAIQREALHQHATLIVIGSRGPGGLARLLLGSTSEALLALARAPVLLVPPTDMDIVSAGLPLPAAWWWSPLTWPCRVSTSCRWPAALRRSPPRT